MYTTVTPSNVNVRRRRERKTSSHLISNQQSPAVNPSSERGLYPHPRIDISNRFCAPNGWTNGIDRLIWMRVKRSLLSASKDDAQTWGIGQPEDTKAVQFGHLSADNHKKELLVAYGGFDLGAHTTANDSGSIRWKPACV